MEFLSIAENMLLKESWRVGNTARARAVDPHEHALWSALLQVNRLRSCFSLESSDDLDENLQHRLNCGILCTAAST